MEVDDDNNVSKKQKQNVNLYEVETYVRSKQYPLRIKSKGDKVNFRRACKKYHVMENNIFLLCNYELYHNVIMN